MVGSVPSAFLGVLVLRSLGDGDVVQARLKLALGLTLLVAVFAMLAKAFMQARRVRREMVEARRFAKVPEPAPFVLKKLPTIVIGIAGGLVVGMTSVGSGSLIIIALMVLYPALSTRTLVGTDLVQAIPLVASAALGHILFGDFQLGLTTELLVGCIPGVYLGARLSSRASDNVIRPALAFVLLASGLKLLEVSTLWLAVLLVAFILVALPIWGVIDAAGRPAHHWEAGGLSKKMWVGVQAFGAPFGVGFWAALAYFLKAKRKLKTAGVYSDVAVNGDEVDQ
jgi:uncharacterized membrane protein YfcA